MTTPGDNDRRAGWIIFQLLPQTADTYIHVPCIAYVGILSYLLQQFLPREYFSWLLCKIVKQVVFPLCQFNRKIVLRNKDLRRVNHNPAEK